MWSVAKSLRFPLIENIQIKDLPYTITYVVKKRTQIDNFNELPQEKRPTERMIWDGTPEEIEDFLDRVLGRKGKEPEDDVVYDIIDIEG